jgi:hypothetical protein
MGLKLLMLQAEIVKEVSYCSGFCVGDVVDVLMVEGPIVWVKGNVPLKMSDVLLIEETGWV